MYKNISIIALCIPKAYEHTDFISRLNDALLEYGYRLVLFHTCSDLFWNTEIDIVDKSIFDLIDYHFIDAFVIYDELFHDKKTIRNIIRHAEQYHIPIVTIGAEQHNHINMVFDYERGFELVVRHVIEEHHCSSLHFIAGVRGEYHSEARIHVFKKILQENAIPFSDDMISYGDYWHDPTRKAVLSLIENKKLPRAIICANDTMAITVCRELKNHGISIPQEVIVTGFDGIKEASYSKPAITTCKFDLDFLIQEIVTSICQALRGDNMNGMHPIGYTLKICSSCGCKNKSPLPNYGHMARKTEDAFNFYMETERNLFELTEKTVMCNSAAEMAAQLKKAQFKKCNIFLNRNFFDNTVNPLTNKATEKLNDSTYIIYMDENEDTPIPSLFSCQEFMPNWNSMLQNNDPIVITALGFWGNPLGYIVHYGEVTEYEYRKINQYVTFISIMLGCNQNVRYIQYTAKYMEELATHDSMTQLYNRKGFYSALPGLIDKATKADMQIAVVSVDADNLKFVNDTFGHESGDMIICTTANTLKKLDYPDGLYARFGGDEFAACIPVSTDVTEDTLISAIEHHICSFNENNKGPFSVSVSVGVQICHPKGFKFDTAYNTADTKMYHNKKAKKKKISR